MRIELGHDMLDSYSTLMRDEDSETKDEIVIQKRKVIRKIRSLTNKGFGSSFMYYRNNNWSNVITSDDYRMLSEQSNQVFKMFVQESFNQLTNADVMTFLGVGSYDEVLIAIESGLEIRKIILVDINPIVILETIIGIHSRVDSVKSDITGVGTDFLKSKISTSKNNFQVLKGGTSGNLNGAELRKVISSAGGDIYIDFFLDKGETTYLGFYDNLEGRTLALSNYIRLFHTAGYRGQDKFNDVVKNNLKDLEYRLVENDEGKCIQCIYHPCTEIISYFFNEVGIIIPEEVEIFHSYRRSHGEFIEHLSGFYEVKSIVSSAGCTGVWLQK